MVREKPRIRLLAAVGLAALLALGAGVVLFTQGQSSSAAAEHTIKPLHPVSKKAKAATRTATRLSAKRPKKTAAQTVGQKLDSLLAKHQVVVVSLYAPKAAVDEMARDEAEAGAKLAGAGFMKVNIFSNGQTRPLLTLLGGGASQADRLLDGPAVLIFQRPKNLFVRLGGYADKDTVAQAAINASPVPVSVPAPTPDDNWARAANSVCHGMIDRLRALERPQTPKEYVDYADRVLGVLRETVARLRALKPPKAQRAQIQQMLSLYDAAVVKAKATLEAALHLDREKAGRLAEESQELGDQGDAVAVKLGATACGADVGQ